jgi:uncharacterized protein YuzE
LDIVLADPVGPERSETVSAILDVDSEGELVGIEVLNLRDQLQSACSVPRFRGAPGQSPESVSYDPEVDALYVRLRRVRASTQRHADVGVGIDSTNALVSLHVGPNQVQ